MAKPLTDRIRAALQPTSRLADARTTLTDAEQALETAKAAVIAAEQKRDDPLVTSEEAAEAHLDVEELQLDARRLVRAIEALRARIAQIETDDAARRHRERYEKAKAERDALVADLQDRMPAVLGELVDLLARIVANDDELAAINHGCGPDTWLASAEAIARECPPTFNRPNGGGAITRLTKLKLPAFNISGHPPDLWPVDRARLSLLATERSERASRERAKAKAKADENRWSWHLASTPDDGSDITFRTRYGNESAAREPICVEMDASQVAEARAAGLTITPATVVKLSRPANVEEATITTLIGPFTPGTSPILCPMTDAQLATARRFNLDADLDDVDAGRWSKLHARAHA